MNFEQFLQWETSTRDTIDFKKTYVDMTGDLIAGLLLSQIVYWYLPGENGRAKLRVRKEGILWLAKERADWWGEIRISPQQFDRACKILVRQGLVTKKNFRFNGLKTMHLRIDGERFMELLEPIILDPPENPYKPKAREEPAPVVDWFAPESPTSENWSYGKHKTGTRETITPLTETTTKTTNNIIPEPEVVPAGEEFSPRQKITRTGHVPKVNITPLSPSTPGATFMFAELAKESHAKGHRAPRRFNTLAQKEMFENAEDKVGEGKVKEFITKALAGGIPHVKGITFYVNKCVQEKPRAKAGEVLDAGEWCEGMQPRLKAGETLVIPSRPPPTSINPGG